VNGRLGLLAALSETILPADGTPGAAEANVAEYLRRVLEGMSAAERAKFESGLDLIDAMAVQSYGRSFVDCASAERSEVLRELYRVPHRVTRSFLSTAVGLVLEGFLCRPSHGGNRGGVGWLAIGYSPEPPGQ